MRKKRGPDRDKGSNRDGRTRNGIQRRHSKTKAKVTTRREDNGDDDDDNDDDDGDGDDER